MLDANLQTELISVDLGDGVIAQVEVFKADTGRRKVSAGDSAEVMSFGSVAKAITKISQVIAAPIQMVRPTKAIVKYGLAISIEESGLVAAIVRGSGKANLEITLEWENNSKENKSDS